jgi:hypothetical protein
MPGFAEPSGQWLGQQLGQLKGDVQALKAQGTEYIVDSEGVCRAILGHLVAGPKGEATGLEGWGVAALVAGVWVKLGGAYVTGQGVHVFTFKSGESEQFFNLAPPTGATSAVGGISTINSFASGALLVTQMIDGGGFFQLSCIRLSGTFSTTEEVRVAYMQWFE